MTTSWELIVTGNEHDQRLFQSQRNGFHSLIGLSQDMPFSMCSQSDYQTLFVDTWPDRPSGIAVMFYYVS